MLGRKRASAIIFPLAALLLFGCSVNRSGVLKPQTITTNRIRYERDGATQFLDVKVFDNEHHLTVEQLARLSRAQLRWQAVTEQACLSRAEDSQCFNWGRSEIYNGGGRIYKKYRLQFVDGKLYVPLPYALSDEFQTFTQTTIGWDKTTQKLTQTLPLTFELSSVQNLGDRYRLTLSLPKNLSYEILDQSPQQIWLRFFGAHLGGSQVLEGDDMIREVRVVERRKSADVFIKPGPSAQATDVRFDEKGSRLVVDVFGTSHLAVTGTPPETAAPAARAPGASSPSVSQAPVTKKPILIREEPIRKEPGLPSLPAKSGFTTIVIDPGHGGNDSGATGVRGTYEKDVNLAVAKSLAEALRRERDVRVILTRESDEFVPLTKRTEIANEIRADLFVSIHCNASLSARDGGFEVYLLSPEATDEAAESVARLENSVVALETHSNDRSSKLDTLLASMAIYNFINESSKCAALLCRGVKNKSSINKTSVREANFHVLRGAQMPGVLVELDYLTNPVSEVKLRSSRFRASVARGLAEGIVTYDHRFLKKEAVASGKTESPKKTRHD